MKKNNAVIAYIAEKKHHPELDGLRGVSILLVFFSHYGLYILPGAFGVTVFFFVSGFLITRLLQVELDQSGSINLYAFYMRRILRLFPALIMFVVFFSILWSCLFNILSFESIFAAIFYYYNYFSLYGTDVFQPYGVLWSLAIEEHYYIFFPALFLALGGSGKKLFNTLVFIIIGLLVWRFFLMYMISFNIINIDTLHLKNSTDTRMDSIAFGALLAVMAHEKSLVKFLQQAQSNFLFGSAIILIIIGLSFKLPVFSNIEVIFNLQFTLRYFLTGSGLFIILNYILFKEEAVLFRYMLSGRFIQYIGRISYSLYLWHLAIFTTLHRILLNYSEVQINLMGMVLSLVAAMFSFHVVEKSANKLRRKWGSNVVR